ncbi:MAG: glycosyltransferase family 2 protein [Planctomycetes bacterium]|nr:glycosyltransferase family 2 protein [Planctomycetota bacterium]MCH7602085.1 glycosyltransferase family 2 protein [Planctomycetota bacterium]
MLSCDLIIPAYNEVENIDALFEALKPLREVGIIRHVVLADNNSTDLTGEAALRHDAIVVHEPRRGYGAACLKAIDWIANQDGPLPDILAFLDADLSDDPAALPKLLAPIEAGKADITIGRRTRYAEPGSLTMVQRSGNRLACFLMRCLGGRQYHDLGPFRIVRWDTLMRLSMADQTWGWTVEMQMKAALLDIPVVEVDVPYRRRRGGRSKISGTVRGVAAAGTKIILTIFSLWWHRRAFIAASQSA